MTTLRDMPTTIAANLRTPPAGADTQVLLAEVLTAYIATYYYAGITNGAMQGHLPPLEELEEDDFAKRLVDSSCNDFRQLEGYIGQFDAPLVRGNRLHHLYVEAVQHWKPLVKDSTTVYHNRQTGA